MTVVPRRRVLKGAGLAGLAMLLPPELLAACNADRGSEQERRAIGRFWCSSTHEAEVVEEATARLVPGPLDDPSEAGHPGAREANVTRYIDTMLGALSFTRPRSSPAGPSATGQGRRPTTWRRFLGLTPAEASGWTQRSGELRDEYRQGVNTLD